MAKWNRDSYLNDQHRGYPRHRVKQPQKQQSYSRPVWEQDANLSHLRHPTGRLIEPGYNPGPVYRDPYAGEWDVPGPYTGVGPRGYQRSNERTMEDIHERLTQNGQIDAGDIQVDVNQGEVTLSGSVFDRRQKRLAEDIAYSVSGVKDVQNRLRIQQSGW